MPTGGVPQQLKDWKSHIKGFLRRRPELIISPTRGYVRLLEEMKVIDSYTADKLCQLDARGLLVRPETFVRDRRELVQPPRDGRPAGELYYLVPEDQRSLLDAAEREVHGYYRRRD